MAHFYGTIQGNRGEATRCGSKDSGLVASARGWNIGGSVRMIDNNGRDAVCMTIDLGSNRPSSQVYLDAEIEDDGKLHIKIGRWLNNDIKVVIHEIDH